MRLIFLLIEQKLWFIQSKSPNIDSNHKYYFIWQGCGCSDYAWQSVVLCSAGPGIPRFRRAPVVAHTAALAAFCSESISFGVDQQSQNHRRTKADQQTSRAAMILSLPACTFKPTNQILNIYLQIRCEFNV